MQDRFSELDDKCKSLLFEIDRATDYKIIADLKREFHTIKLEMIDIITKEDKNHGVTARELITSVKSRKKVPRYATGLKGLDFVLRDGIEVGTLIQLAGQSFAGKTHMALELLSNIAGYSECVLFNFEMGDARISTRLDKLLVTDTQLDNLIIDSRTRNIDMLINEIKIYAKKGVKFFVIDSKMKIESKEKDDFKRFSEITSKLSRVCQENEVIIILINQISEEDLKSGRLSFKGSGDQMYDTDIAWFLVNDGENRKLICSKNRQDEYGYIMTSYLDLDTNTLLFVEDKKGTNE